MLGVLAVHGLSPVGTTGPVRWAASVASVGWLGVDLFFVLSGFLITSILLRTPPRWGSAMRFLGRRALRTWPLYYLTLLAALYLLPFTSVYASSDLTRAATHQVWYLLHLSNLYFVAHDTWGPVALSHYWSLAVEEQYYLVWTVVVMGLSVGVEQERRVHRVLVAGGVLIAVGIVSRVMFVEYGMGTRAVMIFTTNKADALGWGSVVACVVAMGKEGVRAIRAIAWVALGVAGVILLVATTGVVSCDDMAFHARVLPVVEAGFGAWVLLSVRRGQMGSGQVWGRVCGGVWGGVLERGVIPWFGKYSFGLYVWHRFLTPVFDHWGTTSDWSVYWGSRSMGNLTYACIMWSVSLGVAVVSYHGYERVWLGLKDRMR